MKGKVKWFNSSKGWGFITRDDNHQDVFVHYSRIIMQGYKNLQEQEEVEFDLEQGDKGYLATNVQRAFHS